MGGVGERKYDGTGWVGERNFLTGVGWVRGTF